MLFNFVTKLKKSKRGIDESLRDITNIIILSCGKVIEEKRPEFESVVAVQLRNLLFEKNIKYINENVKLKAFNQKFIAAKVSEEETIYFHQPNIFEESNQMIKLEDWLNQKLFYIVRQGDQVPLEVDKDTMEDILAKIKNKKNKVFFYNCYQEATFMCDDESIEGYKLKTSVSESDRTVLLKTLDECGYNYITVSEYIKLIADKTGAHLDIDIPVGLLMVYKDKSINYMIEMGLYVAGVINEYLDRKGVVNK